MTTNATNTDQQVAQSEIADRIAYKYLDRTAGSAKLKSDILSALRSERERGARICEDLVTFTEDHGNEDDSDKPCKWCDALEAAARAIREGR